MTSTNGFAEALYRFADKNAVKIRKNHLHISGSEKS